MYLDTTIRFVAASSESSALQLEAKALLESGWWSAHNNNTSTRCNGLVLFAMLLEASQRLTWLIGSM
jgi:hypothetical protein